MTMMKTPIEIDQEALAVAAKVLGTKTKSARSLADRLEKQRLVRDLFGRVPVDERAYERARAVQQLLTEAGTHRSAAAVDLLIAATAERERLVVLCDNHDYLTVAAVTGQPVQLVTDI
jgi:predicted nucleic acid-binding protein